LDLRSDLGALSAEFLAEIASQFFEIVVQAIHAMFKAIE
jgi:hypothetical protein